MSLIKDRWFFSLVTPPNFHIASSGQFYPISNIWETPLLPLPATFPSPLKCLLSLCSCYSFCLECPSPCPPLPGKPARHSSSLPLLGGLPRGPGSALPYLGLTVAPPWQPITHCPLLDDLSTYHHAWYIVNAKKKCLLNEWMNKEIGEGFPSGSVVKNLPASARDKGDLSSISGLGRSHVLWSN